MSLPLIKHMGGGYLYLSDGPELLPGSMPSLLHFLLLQPYLNGIFCLSKGAVVENSIDLSLFRESPLLHDQHIIRTYFTTFKQDFQPIETPFLVMPEPLSMYDGCKLVNISERYTVANWRWYLKEKIESDDSDGKWIFVGTPQEYAKFENIPGLHYMPTLNAMMLAKMIASASIVYCNQSLVYTIALLAGKKMVVELREYTCAVKSDNVSYMNTVSVENDPQCIIIKP